MEEVKIDGIVLKFNSAERFNKIKEHMGVCSKEELSNKDVARWLIENAIHYYKYI